MAVALIRLSFVPPLPLGNQKNTEQQASVSPDHVAAHEFVDGRPITSLAAIQLYFRSWTISGHCADCVKRGACTSSWIAFRRRPPQQLRQLGELPYATNRDGKLSSRLGEPSITLVWTMVSK